MSYLYCPDSYDDTYDDCPKDAYCQARKKEHGGLEPWVEHCYTCARANSEHVPEETARPRRAKACQPMTLDDPRRNVHPDPALEAALKRSFEERFPQIADAARKIRGENSKKA